eukprot:GHUV01032917.1.p1 GENE.GHUV01032917.1~~GHUV01032917.1.p1  ORF type:complete len:134 (-),score=15.59 GHUV01032917.1:491-892(-)
MPCPAQLIGSTGCLRSFASGMRRGTPTSQPTYHPASAAVRVTQWSLASAGGLLWADQTAALQLLGQPGRLRSGVCQASGYADPCASAVQRNASVQGSTHSTRESVGGLPNMQSLLSYEVWLHAIISIMFRTDD